LIIRPLYCHVRLLVNRSRRLGTDLYGARTYTHQLATYMGLIPRLPTSMCAYPSTCSYMSFDSHPSTALYVSSA